MCAGHKSVTKGNVPGLNLHNLVNVLVLLMMLMLKIMLPENIVNVNLRMEKNSSLS